ncbi:hypothetical protein [Aquirufa nivalisilvae]|uniref:hypothetical protein n=1 Tax=Aquirufa nivalisilvae TaxID=2516557 RepID=UPI0022A9587C|nr:hypothetical protein [Aquirufa nivalisilvae]MCZ2480034.1 hypothetical protein [Aquirufa nivalisilvae]
MKILAKLCLSMVIALGLLLIFYSPTTNVSAAVYEPFKPFSVVEFDTTEFIEWEDHLDTSWTYYGSIYHGNSSNF